VARPTTPIREAVWPIELIESQLATTSDKHLNALRWRDADGQEGQSSVGEIVYQVEHGSDVRVGGAAVDVAEQGDGRWLLVDGSPDALLALPHWDRP
jgi:hypothetical protein